MLSPLFGIFAEVIMHISWEFVLYIAVLSVVSQYLSNWRHFLPSPNLAASIYLIAASEHASVVGRSTKILPLETVHCKVCWWILNHKLVKFYRFISCVAKRCIGTSDSPRLLHWSPHVVGRNWFLRQVQHHHGHAFLHGLVQGCVTRSVCFWNNIPGHSLFTIRQNKSC